MERGEGTRDVGPDLRCEPAPPLELDFPREEPEVRRNAWGHPFDERPGAGLEPEGGAERSVEPQQLLHRGQVRTRDRAQDAHLPLQALAVGRRDQLRREDLRAPPVPDQHDPTGRPAAQLPEVLVAAAEERCRRRRG